MSRTQFTILILITIFSPLSAQDIKPVLTGYSDLLKVEEYDYDNSDFVRAYGPACNDLRDGNPERAIQRFVEYGYDFIHNYPMVACEDDPNRGVMFYHMWKYDVSYENFFSLVNYVVVRDREENGVSGWDSPYCREIFNLRNPRGRTLLDLINLTRDRAIKLGSKTDTVDRVISLIVKLGAKTGEELDAEQTN